jgi:predicted  nucleic acid-binding Zn-ribbon protein
MSDDKNGINERILEGVINLGQEMGHVKGELNGLGEHIQSLDRRLEARDSQLQGYGNEIAKQGEQLAGLTRHIDGLEKSTIERRRKCSDAIQNLSNRMEDTGRHIILEDGRHAWTRTWWARVAMIVGIAASAIGIMTGLNKCMNKNAVSAPRHVDMKSGQPR